MPWSGGSFTRDNGVNSGSDTWAQDKAEPVEILASRHDTHDQDLADGIDNCLTKDGQNSPTANINMATFLLTNLGAPTANGHAIRYNEFAWTDWTPTVNPAGSMTLTSKVVQYARYIQIRKLVAYRLHVTYTVGGTVDTNISYSLPVTATSQAISGSVTISDNGILIPGIVTFGSTSAFLVYPQITVRGAQETFTAGSGAFAAFGFYEAA